MLLHPNQSIKLCESQAVSLLISILILPGVLAGDMNAADSRKDIFQVLLESLLKKEFLGGNICVFM